jgi:hypothetical protein
VNRHIRLLGRAAAWAVFAALFLRSVHGETFVLKSGGRIEGELLNRERGPAEPYVVKTGAGTLKLAKELVSKAIPKSNALQEYELRAPKVANTLDAQWEIAQWCMDNNLRGPREHHLEQILLIDPNHEGARIGLGYQRYDGRWMKPDDYFKSIGYFKYKGSYRTEHEIAMLQRQDMVREATAQWRNKLRIWRKSEGKKREAESIDAIRQIRDAAAIPVLSEYAGDTQESQEWRILFIETIGQFPTGSGGDATLASLALDDGDADVREKCLDILERNKSKSAVRQFVGALKSDDNARINRAGRAIARMRDPDAISALIAALVTKHSFLIQQGGNMGADFTTDGSGQQKLGSFGAGGGPKKVTRQVENEGVREALIRITGENHGFDRDAWRRAYAQATAPANIDLRRDK